MNSKPYAVANKPYATFYFFLICVILFFSVDATSLIIPPVVFVETPSLLNLGKLFLANFLHANFSHLFGNMFVLIAVGYYVEKKIGTVKMLGLMLVSLFLADAMQFGYNPLSPSAALGASGVISGIAAYFCIRQ